MSAGGLNTVFNKKAVDSSADLSYFDGPTIRWFNPDGSERLVGYPQ